jgi:hypothetical protein
MAEAYIQRFTEVHVPLEGLPPVSVAPGTYDTNFADLANYHRAVILITTGVMQPTSDLNAVVVQATDIAGAGATPMWNKFITQLSQAGGDSNSIVAIELKTEELDVENGYHCICLEYLVGHAAVLMSIGIMGIVGRYEPGPQTFWSEIVD